MTAFHRHSFFSLCVCFVWSMCDPTPHNSNNRKRVPLFSFFSCVPFLFFVVWGSRQELELKIISIFGKHMVHEREGT